MRALAALTLFLPSLLLGRAAAAKKRPVAIPCTRTVTTADAPQLDKIVAALADESVLCLAAGTYKVNLTIKSSVTLRGEAPPEQVILDGGGADNVVRIGGRDPVITLERLTFQNGITPNEGAGLVMPRPGELTVRESIFRANRADNGGGAALAISAGHALLERCRIRENHGRKGAAIRVRGTGKLTLRQSLVDDNTGAGSVLWADEAAEVTLDHVTIAANPIAAAIELTARGTGKPVVHIDDSIISGSDTAVKNDAPHPGEVIARRSLFDGDQHGVTDGGGNKIGDAKFEGEEPEPYRVKKTSRAVGIATPGPGLDLGGALSGTTAGALQLHR